MATRERLLAAAVAACVARGFEDTTLGDIAARADVSAPAIYNHFGSKEELLVAAGRWALDRLRVGDSARLTAAETVRAFLADDFADSRRLLAELHLAGQRHPEVAELLAKWHGDRAAEWAQRVRAPDADAVVKTFFALLLGLCQIESMPTLPADAAAVADQAVALAHVLFPKGVLR
jgi:AcrR family transcriptional regulator